MTGRIAVVVTCRDLGRTLSEALESVDRQTRPAAEIVVVDDASDDLYTRQAVARLAQGGTCVVRGDGRGAAAARNLGARATTADYLVWLDADDVLDPVYFERAAARLDADSQVAFVSCALRAFGASSYVWKPSEPAFVDAVSTGGVPHASTMVRRDLWESIGGFDEGLASYELLDFWAAVFEGGFRGVVLDEPLLNYRVRPRSGYRRSIEPRTYRARLGHFYAKHREAVERHGLDLILGKEAFLLEQREYRRSLESRAASREEEIAALDGEIATLSRADGASKVSWGDLDGVAPIDARWGRSRGKPVDRFYIERFLDENRNAIAGRVLEVEEALYATRFGGGRVERCDVLDRDPDNPRANVVADLRCASAIRSETYDCIILTQTLHLIDDMKAALTEAHRLLRPGGVLLATAPSVIRVDDRAGLDGDFWRLTEASARRLLADVFPLEAFDVRTSGNVKVCAAFLYGLSVEDLSPEDLAADDSSFPLVVTMRATRPLDDATVVRQFPGRSERRSHAAAILAYHRIASLRPDTHALCTPPDVFREHMAHLRSEYVPIGLEDLIRAAAAGAVPERAVAVTLDDGYLDALTAASPILDELGIPATFFVNSDRLDLPHERPWDVLEGIFLSDAPVPSQLVLEDHGVSRSFATGTARERAAALENVNGLMWALGACARQRLVDRICAWSGRGDLPRESHRVLTGDEIRLLADRPQHAIGAHTTHHLALTTQDAETRRREVADDKQALEGLLGRTVRCFAYPYGEVDAGLAAAVGQAGFLAALTVDAGLVTAGVNRLRVPRWEIAPHDRRSFAERMREMFAAR